MEVRYYGDSRTCWPFYVKTIKMLLFASGYNLNSQHFASCCKVGFVNDLPRSFLKSKTVLSGFLVNRPNAGIPRSLYPSLNEIKGYRFFSPSSSGITWTCYPIQIAAKLLWIPRSIAIHNSVFLLTTTSSILTEGLNIIKVNQFVTIWHLLKCVKKKGI